MVTRLVFFRLPRHRVRGMVVTLLGADGSPTAPLREIWWTPPPPGLAALKLGLAGWPENTGSPGLRRAAHAKPFDERSWRRCSGRTGNRARDTSLLTFVAHMF